MNKESQLDRFKKAARELGADESEESLDDIMDRLDLKKPETDEKKND